MTRAPRPPVIQAGLAAVAAYALAVGGTVTFEGLGRVPVHPLAELLLVGAALHAASRYVHPGFVPRGLAWTAWAAASALSGPLARPWVVGGIAAAGLLDLAFLGGPDPEPQRSPGSRDVGAALVAGGLGVALALWAAYVAGGGPVAVRLTTTALAGGGLAAAYALRPAARTPGRLLVGALAFAVVFRVLAAPVLPLGPILAYWVLVGAAVLALAAGTRTGVRQAVPDGLERHTQHVEARPDPLDRGLEPALRSYLDGGASPRRVCRAVATLDPELAREVAADLPDRHAPRSDRAASLAEALDAPDLEEPR